MRRILPITRLVSLCTAVFSLTLVSPLVLAQTSNGFDISDASVPFDEILWGGVARDGIPSIDQPTFVPADDARSIGSSDRVLGVYRQGIAKAYPVRILERHEVVNDRFGDERVVVTYCPLCSSGMSFSIDDESVAQTFGVSGLLYNSDVLLYDRQTGSLWSQIMSEAISGPLKGSKLNLVVTAHTSWREWRQRYPDTLLLSTDTGYRIKYRTYPYKDYKRSGRLMFPVANRSNLYRNKERVLGVTVAGEFRAYPFKELRRNGQASFRDSLGGVELIIEWNRKEAFARALDANGQEVPTVIVYWFAWYAFHPGTEIFQAGSG